jgi:hypothetical protein
MENLTPQSADSRCPGTLSTKPEHHLVGEITDRHPGTAMSPKAHLAKKEILHLGAYALTLKTEVWT